MTDLNRKDNIQNYEEDDLLNMLFSGKYQVEQPINVNKPIAIVEQQSIIHKPITTTKQQQVIHKPIAIVEDKIVIHKPITTTTQQPVIHKPIDIVEEKIVIPIDVKQEQLEEKIINKPTTIVEPQKKIASNVIRKIIASNDRDTVVYSNGTTTEFEYKKYGGREQTRSYYYSLAC